MSLTKTTKQLLTDHPDVVNMFLSKWVANHVKLVEAAKIFQNEIYQYKEKYSMDMLEDFRFYWAEPNQNHTKMRFQLEKTWSMGGRLRTWAKSPFNKANVRPKAPEIGREGFFQ
jgi:hypothetical protein